MPVTPKKLDAKCASLLADRLNDEYSAHYFYTQAKNWCEGNGYLLAAKYFEGEASSELEHAAGIQKYLNDWNVLPALKSINPPPAFSGLIDIIGKAYGIEYALFEAYENASTSVFDDNDYATFDFLQKYRNIQTESVAEYSTFLNIAALFDSNDKNWVLNFEEKIFGS